MRFFVLTQRVGSATETLYEPLEPAYGDAERCPKCGLYASLKAWLPPHRVTVKAFGDRVGDVAFGPGPEPILSDAFVTAWREHDLVGLGAPATVDVVAVKPARLARQHAQFSWFALGKGGAVIDQRQSRIVRDGSAPLCLLCGGAAIVDAIDGLHLEEGTWKGADIFQPWGINGVVIVTERVLSLASDYKLNNVDEVPIESYVWDPLRRLGA